MTSTTRRSALAGAFASLPIVRMARIIVETFAG